MATRPPQYLRRPLYGFAEADHLAGVTRGTSRRWLVGYRYRTARGSNVERPPVTPADRFEPGVSFVDLIDIIATGQFRERGFTLPEVRTIVTRCQKQFGVQHPLASLEFKSGGRDVFVSHDGVLFDVLAKPPGSIAMHEVLGSFLETLDYSDAFAHRWWPLGRDKLVVLDPEYGFGLPVIAESGVRTEVILERFRVGDSDDQISDDFNVSAEEIRSALQFELTRAA